MSLFSSRPALRWAVPAGVLAAAIAAGGVGSVLSADAAPALPERSAEQLLIDLQNSTVETFSGTVVQNADLGLPALPSVGGGQGSASLTSLVSGSHTARVWYGGPDKARFALLGTLGESDVIRNKNDVWVWSSSENSATHYTLPQRGQGEQKLPVTPPSLTPTPLPSTPKDAADQLLKAIDPTTKVSTDGTARVAGRSAYELVLRPKDTRSRVDQVRLAIDSKEHVPLRVQVFAKESGRPALEVKFEQISFARPSESQFTFKAPPGTKVTEGKPFGDHSTAESELGIKPNAPAKPSTEARAKDGAEPTIIGKGWTSVVVLRGGPSPRDVKAEPDNPFARVLESLPRVSGDWGQGRLLKSKLFSALLIDDGRLLVGAVSPEQLYAAAADPAAKAVK
jgi:outer membrane lipoprotein-sorting protein